MNKNPDIWSEKLDDGTGLEGVRGGETHLHETGFGTGEIKIQSTGEHIPINAFTPKIKELLEDNGIDT